MPKKSRRDDDKVSTSKPDEKRGHETVDVAFDDIIDAILETDPEAVREHRQRRQKPRLQPLKK
jgi:hypothetical protein